MLKYICKQTKQQKGRQMHKINIIKNNKLLQVLKTDNNISNILPKFNYIKLEKVSLFEYNLYII